MLALDQSELAALIHRGIEALDPGDTESSQEEIDARWREELRRRIEDVEQGRVETVPLDESFARARAAVAALHT